MTTVSWIGLGIMAAILIVGITLYIYFRKKLDDIDGFEGFEKERDIMDNDTDDYNEDK